MGKPTGFMEYDREETTAIEPKERIRNFNEFHIPLSKEKRREQGARCMDCGVPFCQSGMELMGMTSGCPLHNLVPEWNDLVYEDNLKRAYERLIKTNNFPEFTSRVCPALCEKACTCGLNGSPVSVRENENSIIENAYEKGYAKARPPKVRTDKKIAVIGSGPAGLAAADQLNKRGHSVTVYERDDRIGGLLMYGIPNMKLEKRFIERKIEVMKEEGVEFVTGTDVGKDVKAAKILKDYDRVILACGAKNPRDIKAEGRDAKGIYFAVDFLTSVTKSLLDSNFAAMPEIVNQGRRVVNNIRTAASMFLIKTIFSVLLSLITIFFGDAYPFEPIQMSLISACAVGIPTFLLAQENNYEKIDHTFLRHVFMNAFPAAVTITGCVFTVMLVCQNVYHSNLMLNTACVLVTGWNYMAALKTVYAPLNRYRKVIIYSMQVIFFGAAVVLQNLLTLGSLEFGMIILVFLLMTFSPILIDVITAWIRNIYSRSLDKGEQGKFATFIDKLRK